MPRYVSEREFGFLTQEQASAPILFSSAEDQTVAGLAGGGYVVVYELDRVTYVTLRDRDGEPLGDPIAIGESNMSDVDIAALPGGGFVIVWSGSPVLVKAQFFDQSGNPATDILTLDGSNNREQQPAVTVLDNDDVLVAWRANTGTPSIQAVILDTDGVAQTEIFTASQTDSTTVNFPQLAALSDGGFIVSWGESNTVRAQAYDAMGQVVGETVTAPEDAEFLSQRYQSIGGLPDGNYVFTWNEVDVSGSDRIMAAIYSPDGSIIGAPFQVNTNSEYDTSQPNLEVLEDGTFLIAWRLAVPGEGPNYFQIGDVVAQRFDSSGQQIGSEFQINDGTGLGQDGPIIAGFGSDDVVIVWRNWQEGSTRSDVQLLNLYSVTSGGPSGEVMNGTDGVDFFLADGGADTLTGGLGNDSIDGGSNVDTAIVRGNRSAYTITQSATGVFEVAGPDGIDTLTAVEFLQFDDALVRLLPGTGVTVDFETADPSVYQDAMDAIRDFDGNDVGGQGGWLRIGSADVNGDGDIDQILVNDVNGRFATVGTADDGLIYFDDHSWAGETRVAGIYIDPLVASGDVVAGSDNDSQRRFQNDLQIENINRVLGADDYDGDGLQEVYFALTDGTAYLHAYMHADGNIQYANYQSQQEVIDFLTANGFGPETYADWFPDENEDGQESLSEASFSKTVELIEPAPSRSDQEGTPENNPGIPFYEPPIDVFA